MKLTKKEQKVIGQVKDLADELDGARDNLDDLDNDEDDEE